MFFSVRGPRAALLSAPALCLVLAGCATRWEDDGGGDIAAVANQCDTHQGVLGLIVEPASQVNGTLPPRFYQLDRAELVDTLMESGCFSDVRFRRSVSQRGHHVTYSGTTHMDSPSVLNAVVSIPTAFLIPMRYEGGYAQDITFYYHGEEQSSDSKSNRYRQYLSSTPVSNTLEADDFARREARRLAATIVNTIADGGESE